MENRPKIKIILSSSDRIVERVGYFLLVAIWAITIFAYIKLPAVIPTHFNASGKADGFGNKITLLILPVIATGIYLLLSLLIKYPHIFNYATPITEANAEQQYRAATKMLRFLKVCILLIFTGIVVFTYFTTTGVTGGLGAWFLPSAILLILVPCIISIRKSLKEK